LFLESFARPLQVVHLVAAATLVASSTHHLVWSARYLWGNFKRRGGERTLAVVACVAYVVTFGLGLLLYPTYKVRVRLEYFDDNVAVTSDAAARAEAAAVRVERASGVSVPRRAPIVSLAWVGRLFDIKEHLAAIGLALMLALCVISRRVNLLEHREIVPGFVGISAVVCALVWFSAVIGVWVATYRSAGAL
jgi:hypothetical protein